MLSRAVSIDLLGIYSFATVWHKVARPVQADQSFIAYLPRGTVIKLDEYEG